MTARAYGDALADVTELMLHVHEETCEIEAGHGWSRCTTTPTVYAAADALDVAEHIPVRDLQSADSRALVALALHDRECQEVTCSLGEGRQEHALASWAEQADAVLAFVAGRLDTVLPPVASLRGDLMRVCVCGHVRRGHSVDGTRCYASPCTCQPDGGFRPR